MRGSATLPACSVATLVTQTFHYQAVETVGETCIGIRLTRCPEVKTTDLYGGEGIHSEQAVAAGESEMASANILPTVKDTYDHYQAVETVGDSVH